MTPVVSTIETKCRRCYSCIRLCPAKAIKFEKGQAKVIAERCIACGNCIQVCPQNAKRVRDGTEHVLSLLQRHPVIAVVAPSFAAAFKNVRPEQIIAGLKALGFDEVWETAFGADLIMEEYKRLLEAQILPTVITSPCPAIVSYIRKYQPHLTMVLAPVVSPMTAVGRVIKQAYCPQAGVVFIGPCVAKKKEIEDEEVAGAVDEVLTFVELESLFQQAGIDVNTLAGTDFDGPRADLGRLFPLPAGLLKCAGITPDVMDNQILVAEGRDRVLEALQKAETGDIEARFCDLLFCRGCIYGPAMANDESVFVRRDKLINYLRSRRSEERSEQARRDLERYRHVDLRRRFSPKPVQEAKPTEEQLREILRRTGKMSPEDELNCGACGYTSCREKAVAVFQGLAEAEMCLPYALEQAERIQERLKLSNRRLKKSLQYLRQAQEQLIRTEKLASVGKLAAGVAHELNNPLGGILLYANILLTTLKNSPEAEAVQRVASEAERCRHIVQGLLEFSRQTHLDCRPVDIRRVIESTLRLVNEQTLFNKITVHKNFPEDLPLVMADKLQIQQVLLNILINAAEAMQGHGELTLSAEYDAQKKRVLVHIADTGPGMPKGVKERIFDPFFTTKPVGKGTGLGLAIVYGILRKHGGTITVDSEPGKGSTFTFTLPTAETADVEKKL